jgi:hypothetical protein
MSVHDNQDPDGRKTQRQIDQAHGSPYPPKRLSLEQSFGRFGFWPYTLSEPETGIKLDIHKLLFSFNGMTNEQTDFGHQDDGRLPHLIWSPFLHSPSSRVGGVFHHRDERRLFFGC